MTMIIIINIRISITDQKRIRCGRNLSAAPDSFVYQAFLLSVPDLINDDGNRSVAGYVAGCAEAVHSYV